MQSHLHVTTQSNKFAYDQKYDVVERSGSVDEDISPHFDKIYLCFNFKIIFNLTWY